MRKCPNCEQASDGFIASGALVWGTMPIKMDMNGRIISNGPMTAKTVVKEGAELSSTKNVNLTCPHCGQTERAAAFVVIRVCKITGKEADSAYTIRIGDIEYTFPIHNSVNDKAAAIYNPAVLAFESTNIEKLKEYLRQ